MTIGHGRIKGHLSAWLHALSLSGRHGRGLALAAFPALSPFSPCRLAGGGGVGVAGLGQGLVATASLLAGFRCLAGAGHRAAGQGQGGQEQGDALAFHGSHGEESDLNRGRSKPLFDVDPSLGAVPFVTRLPSRMLGWDANKITKLN